MWLMFTAGNVTGLYSETIQPGIMSQCYFFVLNVLSRLIETSHASEP